MTNVSSRRISVYYVGDHRFPAGGAMTNRVLNTARALAEKGFDVRFISPLSASSPLPRDGNYCGFPYYGVRDVSTDHSSQVELASFLLGLISPPVEWLFKQRISVPHVVITYGGTSGLLASLLRYARTHAVVLMTDVVEWQPIMRFWKSGGLTAILDYTIRQRILQPRLRHVIAISSWLERYYRRRGCKTFRLLPVLDPQEARWTGVRRTDVPDASKPLQLLFAGSPARDRHEVILEALVRIRAQGHDVQLEYLGSRQEDIIALHPRNMRLLSDLGNSVRFHGRVPEAVVPGTVAAADYGVMLRSDEVWSRACFPSRLPEFLSVGTPFITNATSDLFEHLRDGNEVLFVPDVTPDAFCGVLHRAIAMDRESRVRMRRAAVSSALTTFDYRSVSSSLASFVDECADSLRG